MNQNPYQSPIGSPPQNLGIAKPNGFVDFRPLVLKWEKYRLIYNAALVATTVLSLMAFAVNPLVIELWIVVFFGACCANILFMLGPALDGYLQVAGFRHRLIGLFIFGCGALIAVGLAALTISVCGLGLQS